MPHEGLPGSSFSAVPEDFMLQATLLALLILVLIIPWLGTHAGIIAAGLVFWIGTQMIAPDRKEMAAQATLARTFNGNVRVSGERLNLDDRHITAVVHNHSNARIYDVWLRCSFQVPQTLYKHTDPDTSKETVSSDYHYGYIAPGAAEEVSLKLEPHGFLARALLSSFTCEANYQHEVADLFKAQG
jgi:hypothetical protein